MIKRSLRDFDNNIAIISESICIHKLSVLIPQELIIGIILFDERYLIKPNELQDELK
ncbi:hypothetical protein [Buchnera aphidicola]|uniref:hypothetical protein n=1 Tax=Buchnera aphidicola TaxID=9 RepID=UPI00346486F2